MSARLLLIAGLSVANAHAANCTLSALEWITSAWVQEMTQALLTTTGGPLSPADFSNNGTFPLPLIDGWPAAVPSLTVVYKVDRSLNSDGVNNSSAAFQIRATYTCTDGPPQVYVVPFTGSALADNAGYSWARIISGGTVAGQVYHSRSLSDNFSIAVTTGFGPVPLGAPPSVAQARTTVRNAALKAQTSVR